MMNFLGNIGDKRCNLLWKKKESCEKIKAGEMVEEALLASERLRICSRFVGRSGCDGDPKSPPRALGFLFCC